VAPDDIEHRGQVGVDPEALIEVAELDRHPARLVQQPDPILGVASPAKGDGQRGCRVRLLDRGLRRAFTSDPDRLACVALGLGKRAIEHQQLGE
jgi:hypothetical protein